MPFTKDDFILCLDARTQDKTIGRFTDETPYAVNGNQARNTTANKLLIAKMDANQNLVFATVTPTDADPRVNLTYTFTTLANTGGKVKDGAYRAFLFAVNLWYNNVDYQEQQVDGEGTITQYGDIVYHITSEKYYRALLPSGPGTTFYEPTVTYWEEYTGNWQDQILSDQLIIHIHDDIVPFNFEDCLKDELSEVADDILCGVCDKWDDILKVVKMTLLLDEANSNNWQDKQTRAEVILQEANKKFCC
jgi:hypothetical protein